MVQEIILFAKDRVGWGPRPPIFGYFHYVTLISLNNFPGGGGGPDPSLDLGMYIRN